jgi:hypothetical protein
MEIPALIKSRQNRKRFYTMQSIHFLLCFISAVLSCSFLPSAYALPPFADIHVHYNWDQADTLDAGEAITRLVENNVVLTVVSSTTPEMALRLRQAGGPWVIPFFMPYLEPGRRHSWFRNPRVLEAARKALASGNFLGIGEFHLMPGLTPSPKRRHPVIDGLMELAIEFDVPLSIHTDSSDYRFFLPLCLRHPKARILWAHAGGLLPPDQVDALMAACPNVWTELSARDNERYIDTPIVDADGRLLPGWVELIKKYPTRFMTGSDPVWPVENRNRWDIVDTGWDRIGEYLNFHRHWLSSLPTELEKKVRLENAVEFFRVGAGTRIQLRD